MARVNTIKLLRVPVEYHVEEPREFLRLTEEEYDLFSCPNAKVATRASSAAERLVKEKKKKPVKGQLDKVKM